jgi:hypothetical protein
VLEGITIITDKKTRGRSKYLAEVAGKLTKRTDGSYVLTCSFSEDSAFGFVDPMKIKGFLVGVKNDTGYLIYAKNGYLLTSGGKGSKRKTFQCVLRETPVNKAFLEKNADKVFEGIKIDDEMFVMNFKGE